MAGGERDEASVSHIEIEAWALGKNLRFVFLCIPVTVVGMILVFFLYFRFPSGSHLQWQSTN